MTGTPPSPFPVGGKLPGGDLARSSSGIVSDQTRRNRSTAGRKAAEATKRKRAAMLAECGPQGTLRGSAMLDPADCTIPAILARLKARAVAP
jgi:hypothetical protein